ncbi:F-box protein At2g17036-like [Silene latifolia]|uniref:F-box protein At2g17036-like n=1 Tax=Silene latifolia TaxID=37657 RepID=UPI003D76C80E
MAADWSTFPLELLEDVAFKLESFEDFIYFSTVCRSWNHASSSIKHLWRPKPVVPWLLLAENTNDNPHCVRKIYNLNNDKCYQLTLPETFRARCWGSPYGWIAKVGFDFDVQLFNPITKASISFPRLNTLPHLPEYDHEIFEDEEEYCGWCLTIPLTRLVVLKLSHNGKEEFVLMAVLYYDIEHVAFARHGDQSWISVSEKDPQDGLTRIVDAIGVDDSVFVLYTNGSVRYWDVDNLFNSLGVVKPMDYLPDLPDLLAVMDQGWSKLYLVQSGTDLLLVVRVKHEVLHSDGFKSNFDLYYQTIDFAVYKIDLNTKIWDEIEDLGDVALFVGHNTSICVPIGSKSLERNCIYFTDDQNDGWSLVTEKGGHDMGVYDIKREQVRRFYEGGDTRSSFCPPTWFIPQL